MSNIVRISCVSIYLFFSQVSPIVHWHVEDCSDSLKLHLSDHPLDFLAQSNEHDDHHHHSEGHEDDDTQFIEVWHFSNQTKTIDYKDTGPNLVPVIDLKDKISHLAYKLDDRPLKLPRNYLPQYISNRAPPQIS